MKLTHWLYCQWVSFYYILIILYMNDVFQVICQISNFMLY